MIGLHIHGKGQRITSEYEKNWTSRSISTKNSRRRKINFKGSYLGNGFGDKKNHYGRLIGLVSAGLGSKGYATWLSYICEIESTLGRDLRSLTN